MMKVTVRLFATLRQLAGWSQQDMELRDGETVKTLVDLLDERTEGLDLANRSVYVAVNQTYTRADAILCDGDEVAFFPPVSGGAWPDL